LAVWDGVPIGRNWSVFREVAWESLSPGTEAPGGDVNYELLITNY